MQPDTATEELLSFLAFWTKNFSPIPNCPPGGLNWMGDFATLTLFRGGQFQVQLAICKPVPIIVEHAHPNVDTVLIHTGGEFALYVDGQIAEPIFEGQPIFRVRAGQKHHAVIGPNGGAFISVQHWLNGKEPGQIEHDWEGEKLDEVHAEQMEKV